MATNPHFGTRSPPARCRRGSLLIAMLLVSTLGILGAPFVTISLNESRLQMMAKGRTEALAVAEAGVEVALREFNYGAGDFTELEGWTAVDPGPDCPVGTPQPRCVRRNYDVKNGAGDTVGTATILAKDVDSTTPTVEATGQGAQASATTKVVVALQREKLSPFQQAAFSLEPSLNGISVDGLITLDSYDSRSGAYGGLNVNANAEIQTNSTGSTNPQQAIKVINGATVKGPAYTAPGGAITTIPGGLITGESDTKDQRFLPGASAPSGPVGCTELGGYTPGGNETKPETVYCADWMWIDGGIVVDFPNLQQLYVRNDIDIQNTNTVLRLGQGTLRVRELRLDSNATLEGSTGRVDVFADGVQLSSNSVMKGASDLPKNLRVYRADLDAAGSFQLLGGSQFYGALYDVGGYTAYIEDDSAFYGAIIGQRISLFAAGTPGFLHFDEALKEENSGWPSWLTGGKSPTAVTITSWQRDPTN